jgi:hypothetical protein
MADFWTDGGELPATKTDSVPVTDVTRQWGASDANALKAALQSMRGAFFGADAGKVLTGNGGGAMPTFQAAGGGGGSDPLPLPPVGAGALLGRWVLNDPTGPYDLTANLWQNRIVATGKNFAATTQLTLPQPSPYGGAIALNGGQYAYSTDDGVNVAATASVLESPSFTVSFLAAPAKITNTGHVFLGKNFNTGNTWSGAAAAWQIYLDGSPTNVGDWSVFTAVGGVGAGHKISAGPSTRMTARVWQWVCVTFDDSTKTLTGYVNAVAGNSIVLGGSIDYGNHGPLYLGANFAGPGSNFPLFGLMNLAELSSHCMTPAEVAAYYAAIKGAQPLLNLP